MSDEKISPSTAASVLIPLVRKMVAQHGPERTNELLREAIKAAGLDPDIVIMKIEEVEPIQN